jgi:hypothetical protein
MKISEVTRRDLIDAIKIEQVNWSGRLDEGSFLARLFNLQELPSSDMRFKNAEGDIWQHRTYNNDWDDSWVFYDDRFNLIHSDDETFLRFLCETIHPVVRTNTTEAEQLCQLYNHYLKNDGFELVSRTRLSGKPVYTSRFVGVDSTPGIKAVQEIIIGIDAGYVSQQITRMEAAVYNDPSLAIGTAKELVESCCKTILNIRGVEVPKKYDLPQLVKLTSKELSLTPEDIPEKAKAVETIRRLLSNLATITQGIAELRNQYGTGHGRADRSKGLSPRHAKLAVGAASTLAVFLLETHQTRFES